MLLTREIVQQSERFEIVEVDVSEWGNIDPETGKPERTTVFVREMSAWERDGWESSLTYEKKGKRKFNFINARARLAVIVCCDENRQPVFRPEDADWLGRKSVRPLERIFKAAKFRGLSRESA